MLMICRILWQIIEQFSTEVFKVKSRQFKDGIPMYSRHDLNNSPTTGLFYNSELQKIEKDENSLWFIEKNLKKRKRRGRIEYFVS